MREPAKNMPVQAINGKCVGCRYRLSWIVIRGKRQAAKDLTHIADTDSA